MSPEPRGAIVGITQTAAEEILADDTDRRLFLVEHDLRGLSSWQLAMVHHALGEAVRRENQRGARIRYVQRIYAPNEPSASPSSRSPSPARPVRRRGGLRAGVRPDRHPRAMPVRA